MALPTSWTNPTGEEQAVGAIIPAARLNKILGNLLYIGGTAGNSGIYTPTITAVANVAASVPEWCWWHRIDGYVFVTGGCTIDPTSANADTTFRMSLPVASDFADADQARGLAVGAGGTGGGAIISVAATNDVVVTYHPTVNTPDRLGFSFGYTVI